VFFGVWVKEPGPPTETFPLAHVFMEVLMAPFEPIQLVLFASSSRIFLPLVASENSSGQQVCWEPADPFDSRNPPGSPFLSLHRLALHSRYFLRVCQTFPQRNALGCFFPWISRCFFLPFILRTFFPLFIPVQQRFSKTFPSEMSFSFSDCLCPPFPS